MSRGKNSGTTNSNAGNGSAQKARNNQVQGPKITGIGSGAVGADHTLTLIFDSDEEMPESDSARGLGNLERISKEPNDNKRLSEIVEDYLDEGNLTPTNMQRRNDNSQNSNGEVDFGAATIEH